jgi:glutaredoxin
MENNKNIIVYGTHWCPDCVRTKFILDRKNIAYDYVDIDHDPSARKFVMETNRGYCSVPTILFPDGSTLTEPDPRTLEAKIASFMG